MAQDTLGKSSLYLPPIEEGAVLRDFYDGEIHFPAGYVGYQKVRYVAREDDGPKPWAYVRRPF